MKYEAIPDFVLGNFLEGKTDLLGGGNWDLLLCILNGYIERGNLKRARKCSLLLRFVQEIIFPNRGYTLHEDKLLTLKQDFSSYDQAFKKNIRTMAKHGFLQHFRSIDKRAKDKLLISEKVLHEIIKSNILHIFPNLDLVAVQK